MLPSVQTYLERLPRGLDSFPYAQIKGGVVRQALERAKLAGPIDQEDAPDAVTLLARDPPPVNSWVPEVHYSALTAAIYDLRFRHAGGLPAYERWVYDGNLKMFRGPVYRVLFFVIGPERAFAKAAGAWGQFHRGSILSIVQNTPKSARLRLTYPAGLFAEQIIRGFAMAFQAGAVAVGGEDVKVALHDEAEGSTLYEATWR